MKKTGNSFQSGPNLMSFVFIRGVGCKITHFSRDPSGKSWRTLNLYFSNESFDFGG